MPYCEDIHVEKTKRKKKMKERKEREKKKKKIEGALENSSRDKSWKPPLNGEGNSSLSPNTAECYKQDEPKVQHPTAIF